MQNHSSGDTAAPGTPPPFPTLPGIVVPASKSSALNRSNRAEQEETNPLSKTRAWMASRREEGVLILESVQSDQARFCSCLKLCQVIKQLVSVRFTRGSSKRNAWLLTVITFLVILTKLMHHAGVLAGKTPPRQAKAERFHFFRRFDNACLFAASKRGLP